MKLHISLPALAAIVFWLAPASWSAAITSQDLLNQVKQLYAEYDQSMLELKEALADGDSAAQLEKVQSARQKIESIINLLTGSPDVINPREAMVKSYLNTDKLVLSYLKKAEAIYQNVLKTQSQKIAATKQVQQAQAAALRKFSRWRASFGESFVLLEEINAAHTGFEHPGKTVCYKVKVYGDPAAIPAPITVNVVNPAIGLGYMAVQEPGAPITLDLTTERKFCVTMANNLGGGRVDIFAGGQLAASRLLFNKGEKLTVTKTGGPFDGNYSGNYSGQAVYTVDGEVNIDPVPPGGCGASIFRTGVTVTSPGPGKGRIAANGFASFTAGGGSLSFGGANVTFKGSLEKTRSGAVIGRGSWSTRFTQFGIRVKASGGWQVTGP